jgi:hypothetical protein
VADLVDADPAAAVIAYLNGHTAVEGALGGAGRISARNEPPYPHLGVTDTPGGTDRDMRWLTGPEITLTLWGDLDGTPGKAALRRIFYTIVQALRDFPDQPTEPGQPVVTEVRSTGAGGWSPEPTGQPRYLGRVQVFMHPPQSIPAP